MSEARRWWLIFAACSVLVVGALAGISGLALGLERSERRAQADAGFQESLRLAMWRMESWLAPHLAREASRQRDDYRPFVPQPRALKRDASGLLPEEVLVPSPLLSFRSDLFPLHFQLDTAGGLTSPQLPDEGLQELAGGEGPDAAELAARSESLQRLRPLLGFDDLIGRLNRSNAEGSRISSEARAGASSLGPEGEEPRLTQLRKTQAEYEARVSCAVDTTAPSDAPAVSAAVHDAGACGPTTVGPLVPLWLDNPNPGAGDTLVLIRVARIGGACVLQGTLVDWDVLRERLLAQIRDLFPDARLEPIRRPGVEGADPGRDMAMLPARLRPGAAPQVAAPWLTATRATLGLGWLATCMALVAAGLTLRRSIEFGVQRERFVSAVTHEMRTPLTTFRMYAGMLADGMVADDKKKGYLETLREEASRLSAMVENVLSFARLERGRHAAAGGETLTVGELLDRVAPPLRRRVDDAGMALVVGAGPSNDRPVEVDVEPVGQILGNLVDNACKYAKDAADPTIHVEAEVRNGTLRVVVRDHGPGVPPHRRRDVFAPFHRGDREEKDGLPGVGLGLAIARGLARDMGGDLSLRPAGNDGACFVVELPTDATA